MRPRSTRFCQVAIGIILLWLLPVPELRAAAGDPPDLDNLLSRYYRSRGIKMAPPADEATILRRLYLTVAGRLPTLEETRTYLAELSPDRRAELVDRLIESDDFALISAMRWSDALRVKSEFPVNLWPNAVQTYHRWIFESIRDKKPYDQFVRECLTASGSNFREPPVNFLRAVPEKSAEGVARMAALTFLGTRWNNLSASSRDAWTRPFERLEWKSTAEWKEEIVFSRPAPGGDLILPDGKVVALEDNADPRKPFADWLTHPDHEAFARAGANRIWAVCFGRGLVHEPDDFRSDNPPAIPGVLEALARYYAKSGFQDRACYRLILLSEAFARSSGGTHHQETCFAAYPVSPVEAEVLLDILCAITGTTENYVSPIPEPFTYLTRINRSAGIADGSISSTFLDLFGRPARDTGLWSERGTPANDRQLRYLINSEHIIKKLRSSKPLNRLIRENREPGELVETLYLRILCRPPTDEERGLATDYLTDHPEPRVAPQDLAWALINTREFLLRH